MKCTNCDNQLTKEANFCLHCGQSTMSIDRNFGLVFREQMHELLDIDGRLARSLKTLVTQPGEMTRAYINGRRMTYTPPLRLYLIISILFFLLFSYIYPIYTKTQSDAGTLSDYYSKAMFILFPIFALLMQIFFAKSRFLGNLVFSLHTHSLVYLVLMIIAPLEANESKHIILVLLQIPPSLYLLWYSVKSVKVVYQQSWLKTLVKTGAIVFIYMGLLGIAFDVVLEGAL